MTEHLPQVIQITQLTPAMTTAAQQAATLLHQVFAPQGSWETLAEAIQEVAEMLVPERMVWVAMIDEAVIGWIGGVPQYDGNVWELHPLVVEPAWQRQGIGTRLVRHFEQQAGARGGLTISLASDDKHNQVICSKLSKTNNRARRRNHSIRRVLGGLALKSSPAQAARMESAINAASLTAARATKITPSA